MLDDTAGKEVMTNKDLIIIVSIQNCKYTSNIKFYPE